RDPRVEPGRADLDGAVGERVGALRVEAARGDLAAVRVDGAKTQPEPAQRDGRAVRGGAQRSEADCRSRLDREAAARLGGLDLHGERDVDRLRGAHAAGGELD